MESVCIVLRNAKSSVSGIDFSSVLDTFAVNGYYFGKIILLAYDDVDSLQTEVKNALEKQGFSCLICEEEILPAVQGFISDKFSLVFEKGLVATSPFAILPTGQAGVTAAKEMVPLLFSRFSASFDHITLRMVGASEEDIGSALQKGAAVLGEELDFNYVNSYDDQILQIVFPSTLEKLTRDNLLRSLLQYLQPFVYTMDDTTLEERVCELLKLRKLKLSIAESFTGGGVAERIVSVPGASNVYFEGLNTYDEKSKVMRLSVNEGVLNQYGAASAEVAKEMAEGLLSNSFCDVTLATTGIAGPSVDSGDSGKSVGTAFIATAMVGQSYVNEFHFTGDRKTVMLTAVNHALFMVYKLLQ